MIRFEQFYKLNLAKWQTFAVANVEVYLNS